MIFQFLQMGLHGWAADTNTAVGSMTVRLNYRFFLLVTYPLFFHLYFYYCSSPLLSAAHSLTLHWPYSVNAGLKDKPKAVTWNNSVHSGRERRREPSGRICVYPRRAFICILRNTASRALNAFETFWPRSCRLCQRCINQTTSADFLHLCLRVNFPLFRNFRDQQSAF